MGMTIEQDIKVIRKMLAYTDLSVRANLTADMVDACEYAIETMRKYQKIEEIVNDRYGKPVFKTLDEVIKVVEDENYKDYDGEEGTNIPPMIYREHRVKEISTQAKHKGDRHMRLIDANDLLTVTDIRADGTEFTYVSYGTIEEAPTVEAISKADYEDRLKADMVAMLTEIQLEILELKSYESADGQDLAMLADIGTLFQQKIDKLKENKNG